MFHVESGARHAEIRPEGTQKPKQSSTRSLHRCSAMMDHDARVRRPRVLVMRQHFISGW